MKITIEKQLNKLGWELWNTGGGIMAWRLGNNDKYILLGTDGGIPTNENQKVGISFYDDSIDGDYGSYMGLDIICVLSDILNGKIQFKIKA